MTAASLLADLRQRGVRLEADGDRLHCEGPPGTLTPDLIDQLKHRKTEILSLLEAVSSTSRHPSIVPLATGAASPAIFAVPGHNGDVFAFRDLAGCLDRQIFGLEPPGLDGRRAPLDSIEALASYFAAQVVDRIASAPCVIAGYCAGGTVAFELARQLRARGVRVAALALFGAAYPHAFRPSARRRRRALEHVRQFVQLRGVAERAGYLSAFMQRRFARAGPATSDTPDDPVQRLRDHVERTTLAAVCRYRPERYEGRTHMFLPGRAFAAGGYQVHRWRAVAPDVVEHLPAEECARDYMLRPPHAAVFATLFRNACLPA